MNLGDVTVKAIAVIMGHQQANLKILLNMLNSFNLFNIGVALIIILICWNTYLGKDWARLVLGLLLVSTGIQMILGGVGLFAMIYFIFAGSLFFIPQVNRYFEYASGQTA